MFDIQWVGIPAPIILISKAITIISLAGLAVSFIYSRHHRWKLKNEGSEKKDVIT